MKKNKAHITVNHPVSSKAFLLRWSQKILTLRRQNHQVTYAPVVPDLAQTEKVRSDRSESLTNVFGRAGNCSLKFSNISRELSKIKISAVHAEP